MYFEKMPEIKFKNSVFFNSFYRSICCLSIGFKSYQWQILGISSSWLCKLRHFRPRYSILTKLWFRYPMFQSRSYHPTCCFVILTVNLSWDFLKFGRKTCKSVSEDSWFWMQKIYIFKKNKIFGRTTSIHKFILTNWKWRLNSSICVKPNKSQCKANICLHFL